MITATNLKKAGFCAGEWEALEDGGRFRTWRRKINEGMTLEVDEENIPGRPICFLPCLISIGNWFDLPQLDSVTKLLELIKLLR